MVLRLLNADDKEILQVKVERLLGSFEDEVADEEFNDFFLRGLRSEARKTMSSDPKQILTMSQHYTRLAPVRDRLCSITHSSIIALRTIATFCLDE
jgi:hypothetical protein